MKIEQYLDETGEEEKEKIKREKKQTNKQTNKQTSLHTNNITSDQRETSREAIKKNKNVSRCINKIKKIVRFAYRQMFLLKTFDTFSINIFS